MTPFGSVGGCHSKVTEEAVTLVKVTFCGGSNGSGGQDTKVRSENDGRTQRMKRTTT